MKRLDGVSRSPVFSTFEEILRGAAVVRAYRREAFYTRLHQSALDRNGSILFISWMSSRWIAMRMDLIAGCVTLSMSILVVVLTDVGSRLNPSVVGLALVYALQLVGILQWTVRLVIETENNMTSVERLLHFGNVPQEPPETIAGKDPDDNWPAEGRIAFRNVR